MYKPRSQKPADYMSHLVKSVCEWGQKIAEEYVSYLCEQTCHKAVPLNELKKQQQKIHSFKW